MLAEHQGSRGDFDVSSESAYSIISIKIKDHIDTDKSSEHLPGNRVTTDSFEDLPGNRVTTDSFEDLPGNRVTTDSFEDLPGHRVTTKSSYRDDRGANYTAKRRPVKLVYYEEYSRIDEAFYREEQVQGWSRKKKLALIEGKPELLPQLAKKIFRKTKVASIRE